MHAQETQQNGYKDVLLGMIQVPSDAVESDLTTQEWKESAKIKKLNNVAYGAMILLSDGQSYQNQLRKYNLCINYWWKLELMWNWLLVEIKINAELPIPVWLDNIGAIFRFKNMNTRLRFVDQSIDDGFIKGHLVGTNENDTYLLTKNLSRYLRIHHSGKIVDSKKE